MNDDDYVVSYSAFIEISVDRNHAVTDYKFEIIIDIAIDTESNSE